MNLDELRNEIERLLPARIQAGAGEGAQAPLPESKPVASCEAADAKTKGYHLDIKIPAGHVVIIAELLNERGFAMDTVTGVDWLAAGEMEVIYDFYHMTDAWQVVMRTRVPRATPEVPTISEVFSGANWHERETHELLGIRFTGHPNLTPLLLPEDATYHPLRKDFAGAN